jgi:hypothetical protein
MIKPNENAWNEYYALVDVKDREKILALTKKMSESKPGLLQQAKFELKDRLNGDIEVWINNTSAFDYSTKRIIFNYINALNKFY